MREPTQATPGSPDPERMGVQPASGAAPIRETTSEDAARMAQAIDAFIRQDRDDRPEPDAPAFDPLARRVETDIVARLAPRRLDHSERLPRFVTSALPIRPPPLPGDDRWRRRDAHDGAPMAPVIPPPLVPYAHMAHAGGRQSLPVHEPGHQRPDSSAEPSPFAARWPKARHAIAAAVATTCLFSTGALWATHRTEMVTELGGQPPRMVDHQPVSTADAGATPGQPIRNTPVLVREGEALALVPAPAATTGRHHAPPAVPPKVSASAPAPVVPRTVDVGEPLRAVPVVAIAPVVRVVPVVPIVPAKPIVPAAPAAPIASVAVSAQAVAVASGRSMDHAVAPVASQPLDRDGMTERAARPAEVPTIDRNRTHREHPARTASVGRVTSEPFQSRGPAPGAARRRVPADNWAMRRQSLRGEPEPEPSTLKKLIGLVWPLGKSSTTAEPSKPAAPTATKTVQPWSDSTRANP